MCRRLLLASLLAVLGTALAGCGSQKDIGAASEAVSRFHAQLDNQDYQTIYSQTDERFRNASSQPDFLALMNAIHTKLGKVTDASRQGFFVNYNTSGMQVRLAYSTRFAGGDAQEEFVWARIATALPFSAITSIRWLSSRNNSGTEKTFAA